MVGWALVIGFGILNGEFYPLCCIHRLLTSSKGYMTFKPAFEAREQEKMREESVYTSETYGSAVLMRNRERAALDLGPGMIEIPAQTKPHALPSGALRSNASE